MSTLSVATIKSASSASPVFQNSSGTEKGQLAKVWVNFDGTGTVTIKQSFNVSSITDTNTGKYVINYTNALANDEGCSVHGGGRSDSNFNIYRDTDVTASTSSCSIRTTYDWSGGGNTHTDIPRVFCAIFNVD